MKTMMKSWMTVLAAVIGRLHGGATASKIRKLTVASGVVLSSVAIALIGYCVMQYSAPAGSLPEDPERELALESFDDAIVINQARQQEPDLVEEDAIALFSILNPHLVLRERLKDPEQVKADMEVLLPMLDPKQMEAKLREEPEFRRQQEEAFRALKEATGL